MAPSLVIEYQQRPRQPTIGWLLLALGITLALSVGSLQSSLERDLAAVERARNPASAARSATGSTGTPANASLLEAQDVLRQLATPWGTLFRSIEGAHTDEIALLSVQPDAQRQAVTIVGEAKEYRDVLIYVSRLKAEPALAEVYLSGNELKESDPQRPLTFTITARWRAACWGKNACSAQGGRLRLDMLVLLVK